jgi:hypothetical protein
LKRIIFESDGGENATELADLCFGEPSDDFGDWSTDLTLRELDDWGMTLGSWQSKVVRRATRLTDDLAEAVASPLTREDWFPSELVWHVDLHFGLEQPIAAFAAAAPLEDLDAGASAGFAAQAAPLPPSTIVDAEYSLFQSLGNSSLKSTFATYVNSPENEYGVDHPIPGDVDNGGCVNQVDLCVMMRSDVWQTRALPPSAAVLADLNRDGWVNEADQAILVDGWGDGCAAAPPPLDLEAAVDACRDEYARNWLSFEDQRRVWSVSEGSVQLSTTPTTPSHLATALQLNGCQYAKIDSPLFNTSELPAGSKLALDVRLPTQQSNPYWLGDVQLHVTIPGANIHNAWVGQWSFAGRPLGAYHTATFNLPQSIRTALAGGHPNAQLHLAFNTGNCLAPILMDNVRITD